MINENKITLIMSGRYEPETKSNILNIRKILPKSEIILSTYNEAKKDAKIYKKYGIKLIINKDFGDYLEFSNNSLNLIRMMKSFHSGLKISKNEIILKIRTDYSLNSKIKEVFFKIQFKRKKIIYKKKKYELENIYLTDSAHFNLINYHFSDQVILGRKKQLLNLYNVKKSKFIKKDKFSRLPSVSGKYGNNLVNEQLIWINFLMNIFKEKDAYKIYKNRNLHVQIFNNLKIIDKKYFVVPERLNNLNIKIRNYAYNKKNFITYLLRFYYHIRHIEY